MILINILDKYASNIKKPLQLSTILIIILLLNIHNNLLLQIILCQASDLQMRPKQVQSIIMNTRSLDISDSPQVFPSFSVMFNLQVSMSQNLEEEGKSKKTKTEKVKLQSQIKRSLKKMNRREPLMLRNVDGMLPQEIFEFSNKKLNVEEIEHKLIEFEKIDSLWQEFWGNFTLTNPEFSQIPDFDGHEESDYEVKVQTMMEVEESPLPLIKVENIVMPVQNYLLISEHVSNQHKLKMLKMRKYYTVYKRKLMKFLDEKRLAHNVDYFHVCKHCGSTFQSGRQLGGHVSKKHLGQSELYKNKTKIYKVMKEERNRRKVIRKMKLKVKREEFESKGQEEDGECSVFQSQMEEEVQYPIIKREQGQYFDQDQL